MPSPHIRSLEVLSARWAKLPAISPGAHIAWSGTYSIMERVAVVLEESFSLHPAGVSNLIGGYARALSDFVMMPELLQLDDPLFNQRARLDALGPRIAAYCAPNARLEQRCLSLCLRLALRLASGWIMATHHEKLTEHATKLKEVSEAETLEYLSAARAAGDAERAIHEICAEVVKEAHAAFWVAKQSGQEETYSSAYLTSLFEPYYAAEEAAHTTYWVARCVSWTAKSNTKSSKVAKGTVRVARVPAAKMVWRTEMTPALCSHIQSDADLLLATLSTMIGVWESIEA